MVAWWQMVCPVVSLYGRYMCVQRGWYGRSNIGNGLFTVGTYGIVLVLVLVLVELVPYPMVNGVAGPLHAERRAVVWSVSRISPLCKLTTTASTF